MLKQIPDTPIGALGAASNTSDFYSTLPIVYTIDNPMPPHSNSEDVTF